MVGVVRAAADVAFDHGNEDGGRFGPVETAAPEPAVPLLDLAHDIRAAHARRGGRARPREGRQHRLDLDDVQRADGPPVPVDHRQHGACPVSVGNAEHREGRRGLGWQCWGAARCRLLVGTAASLTEADASANPRSVQVLSAPDAWHGAWSRATLGGMSDSSILEGSLAPSGHPPYDRSPRRALDEMSAEARDAWRNRYATQAEGELRVQPNGPGPGDPRRERPQRTAAVAGVHRVERPHGHSDHC